MLFVNATGKKLVYYDGSENGPSNKRTNANVYIGMKSCNYYTFIDVKEL